MSQHIIKEELQIVNNILDESRGFLSYRNLKYMPEESDENPNLQLETIGYTISKGKNADGGVVIVCVVANQEHVIKNKSLINAAFKSKNKLDISSEVINIIFIIPDQYYKPNIIVALKELFTDIPCNVHPYKNFVLPIPFCAEVPVHTVLTKEQAENLLQLERISFAGLPIIHITDPPVVWLGARKDDIIKIDNYSLTSVSTVIYRRVV